MNFDGKIMIIRKQMTDSSLNLCISPKLSCPESAQHNQDLGSSETQVFFNDTATPEIYTSLFVVSVRCVIETGKYPSFEASFQKIGTEMAPHQTGRLSTSSERQYSAVSKSPHCCSIILLFQLN